MKQYWHEVLELQAIRENESECIIKKLQEKQHDAPTKTKQHQGPRKDG